MEISEGFFRLMKIAPIDDEAIENLYPQVFVAENDSNVLDFQWPVLDTLPRASHAKVLIIEPGESRMELGEFIVLDEVETILVYSYFNNSRSREIAQSTGGWAASTVYDIIATD